ncbi:MAG: dihydrolipoamide acetyltransferase family protein [Bacteroidetes bacterium]|nr:dihydrolipoamide acetyltransferase family protein [Bacteroidota bacterium]
MLEKSILMPKMGESIAEATIIRWLKNEGEFIQKDESIVEIATDKVDSEIPSSEAGLLVKKLCKDGDVVKVGEAVALIRSEDPKANQIDTSPVGKILQKPESSAMAVETALAAIEDQIQMPLPIQARELGSNGEEGRRFYSPLVLNIARAEGISLTELESLSGTGKEGRVTKADILLYISGRGIVSAVNDLKSQGGSNNSSDDNGTKIESHTPILSTLQTILSDEKIAAMKVLGIYLQPGDEVIEMDRVRQFIADHMVKSKQTSPHVSSFVEADVTNMVNWRNRIKESFKKTEGENITFTPIFIEAVSKAIKDFPMINVSVEGSTIIKKKNINIGLAVAQKNGNLIVPVIKSADAMNLLGLTRAVNDLAIRAREGKLLPDETQGGTYTITNVGTFGNIFGTPVINQPQVAILAMGSIRKKPAVLETEHGDVIAIRHMMYLSHSYDHRVVDGALGGMFVRKVADYLEEWDSNREI